ncbi:MAG: hypothetical protein FJ011_05700 [Chloroflexi bacterium]|nr:hypothetical protein [Chloroflexota bacterium]
MNGLDLAFLARAQNADGGWGYGAGESSTVEATAAVVLALARHNPAAAVRQRGLAWLAAAQHADGGWGLARDDPESGWTTAWGVLALMRTDAARVSEAGYAAAVQRGVAWLMAVKALRVVDDRLQNEMRQKLAVDPTLSGWPWRPGEATWIEPTALAMLALSAAETTAAAAARLDEASRYLQDRRCRGGGWNFGNPVMLGGDLPPRSHPTAWALLALQRVSPQAIRDADLQILRDEMHRDGGALALAWGLLALAAVGNDDPAAAERLRAMQRSDGSWNANPYHTAIAALTRPAAVAARGHLPIGSRLLTPDT